MRAPNCRCRSRASSRKPASLPGRARWRRSPVRSARKMTSAPIRTMPAPRDRWSLRVGRELAGAARRPVPNRPRQFRAGKFRDRAHAFRPASAAASAVVALPLAAADASPTEKPTGSVQMLLIAIVGALALAGLLASAIFRLSGRRRNNSRVDRRVNWDSVRTDRPSLSDEARARRCGTRPAAAGSLPRELRAADDPNERIAQMLSRLAAKRRDLTSGYFSSCCCKPRTNSVRPTRRKRLSRSALRIDCTSAKASWRS